ncbi:MAG: glycosyltransferase family 61 protein [Acidimicrobiia bacterium]
MAYLKAWRGTSEVTSKVRHWRLRIEGWAANVSDGVAAADVSLSIGGVPVLTRRPRVHRPDVAAHFSDPRLAHCGYRLTARVPDPAILDEFVVVARLADGELAPLPLTVEAQSTLGERGVDRADPTMGAIAGLPRGYVDYVVVTPKFVRESRPSRAGLVRSAVESDDWLTLEAALACGEVDFAAALVRLTDSLRTSPQLDLALAYFGLGADEKAAKCLRRRWSPEPGKSVEGVLGVRESTSLSSTPVLSGTTVEVALPEVWRTRPAGTQCRTLIVPPLGVSHLEKATIVRGSTVIQGESLVLYDESARPSLGFVAGNQDHLAGVEHRADEALLFARYQDVLTIEEGILLSGRADFNHFHFLVEYLPRLGLVERIPELGGVPVIVTDTLGSASREALGVVALGRPVITIRRDQRVTVDRLHIPSMHTYAPDTTRIPWIEGCRYSVDLLGGIRGALLDRATPGDWPPYVFLERNSSARGLLNSDAVFEALAGAGFVSVDPASLSMLEQVSLFNQARVIVGVGGAAFANLLFAHPAGHTIALVSDQLHDFCMHATLAAFSGHRFTYVTGRSPHKPTDFSHRRDYLHAPFSVDPELVREAAEAALDG